MRTEKMIRATFLVEKHQINVNLPKNWQELTNDELGCVHELLACYDDEDARFHVFRHLASLKVTSRDPIDGKYCCVIDAKDGKKVSKHIVYLSPMDIVGWLEDLNWIYEPGAVPVRLDTVRRVPALNSRLYDVPFGAYLAIENYYQGFLQSKNTDALSALYSLLYPHQRESWKYLSGMEISNILTWIVQLKNLFAKHFPHLFQPSAKSSGTPNMLEIMNNEIRILTGGDVTKEAEVKEVECWRCLTELDFKAKEAEELKRLKK